MERGGKRKGAGRPKGSVEDKTVRKRAVKKAIDERVMRHADKLFHAQLTKAVGSVMVFRVDKGRSKTVHTQITDPAEIKRFLDEHGGQSGIVGDSFYFVTDVAPDNRAIDSMLDRTFGRANKSIELSDPQSEKIEQVLREIKLLIAKQPGIAKSEEKLNAMLEMVSLSKGIPQDALREKVTEVIETIQ